MLVAARVLGGVCLNVGVPSSQVRGYNTFLRMSPRGFRPWLLQWMRPHQVDPDASGQTPSLMEQGLATAIEWHVPRATGPKPSVVGNTPRGSGPRSVRFVEIEIPFLRRPLGAAGVDLALPFQQCQRGMSDPGGTDLEVIPQGRP